MVQKQLLALPLAALLAYAPQNSRPSSARGEASGFEIRAVIEAGRNPHQIAFSPDGRTAWVAASGSDWIAEIDAVSLRLRATHPVAETPLGAAALRDGSGLLVSRFRGETVDLFSLPGLKLAERAFVGPGPSLLYGPLASGAYVASVERGDALAVVKGDDLKTIRKYPTGKRPFPPAVTSDGRLAFVPNYDDGTVTVVNLAEERIAATVRVGQRPSGGAVLPGDKVYAVAVRGENRVVFVDAASHQVTGSLEEGIGESPFSVVVSPDGRRAFVNNTASHDVSVALLPERRVVARIAVGEIPIVMAVHPSGETLWVSSEGSHEVSVISIP